MSGAQSPRQKAKKGVFGVAGLDPIVTVTSPTGNHIVSKTGSPFVATFSVVGSALDPSYFGSPHEGSQDVSSTLQWVSDKDGLVGTGASPSLTLTTGGQHVITVSARATVQEAFRVTSLAQLTASDSDWFSFQSVKGNTFGVWLNTDGLQTGPAPATVVVGGSSPEAAVGTLIGVDLTDVGTKEQTTLTFNRYKDVTDGTYLLLTDRGGNTTALWYNLPEGSPYGSPNVGSPVTGGSPYYYGSPVTLPSGATFTNADTKLRVDLPVDTAVGSPEGTFLATTTYNTLNGSSAVTDFFTLSRSDNVITLTSKHPGPLANVAVTDEDGTALTASTGSPLGPVISLAVAAAGAFSSDASDVIAEIQSTLQAQAGLNYTAVIGSPANTLVVTASEAGNVANARADGSPPQTFTVSTTSNDPNDVAGSPVLDYTTSSKILYVYVT